MIESFVHKGLKRLHQKGDASGIGPNILARIEEILTILNVAEKPEDADIPGYRLHPLTGNLKGYWSIKVTGNWRVIFRFENGNVHDVDLVDYH